MRTDHFRLGPGEDDDVIRAEDATERRWIYVLRMTRRSIAFDALLAGAVLALGQAEVWAGTFVTRRQGPAWAEASGYGLAAAFLVIRRVHPLRCVLLVCGAMALEFAVFGSPEGLGVMTAPMIAVYTVANREERRRALVGLAAVLALGVAWMGFDPAVRHPIEYVQASAWLSPWIIAWLLGAYLRTRRLYQEGLVREREERALTAVAEERNRIARELHDVVGHSVSLMTVQASAVRRLMRPDQEKERVALETVEAAGREALTEMRRMVGVLRSGDVAPNLAPPPTLDQVDRLVDTFRRSGLEVSVETTGEPAPLPPGLDLTAYRLVQEALTNTLRHARATRAAVHIGYGDDCLVISVRDDGAGPNGSPPGTGLLGMRERVGVYGGTLTTGPAEGGGFELRAELPMTAS
ncbi:MAG TPA: sensor histidine kinase [Blastococcus sp.]|nr:sensor histidine kinase [Blastococcus sp.]